MEEEVKENLMFFIDFIRSKIYAIMKQRNYISEL